VCVGVYVCVECKRIVCVRLWVCGIIALEYSQVCACVCVYVCVYVCVECKCIVCVCAPMGVRHHCTEIPAGVCVVACVYVCVEYKCIVCVPMGGQVVGFKSLAQL